MNKCSFHVFKVLSIGTDARKKKVFLGANYGDVFAIFSVQLGTEYRFSVKYIDFLRAFTRFSEIVELLPVRWVWPMLVQYGRVIFLVIICVGIQVGVNVISLSSLCIWNPLCEQLMRIFSLWTLFQVWCSPFSEKASSDKAEGGHPISTGVS